MFHSQLPTCATRCASASRARLRVSSRLGLAAHRDVDARAHDVRDGAVGVSQGRERRVDVHDAARARRDRRLEARGLAARGARDGLRDPRPLDLGVREPRELDEAVTDDLIARESRPPRAAPRSSRARRRRPRTAPRTRRSRRARRAGASRPRRRRRSHRRARARALATRTRRARPPPRAPPRGSARRRRCRGRRPRRSTPEPPARSFDRHSCALPPKENRLGC